jgi:hypothetical protein
MKEKKELFKKLYIVKSGNNKVYNFNGKVHVGNNGTVFVEEGVYGSKNLLGNFRKPRKTHNGYLQIRLMDIDGKGAFHYIHRLVAHAWLKKKDWQYDVLHKDDNPLNNSVSNLSWGTHAENMQDMVKKGRQVSRKSTNPSEVLIDIYTRRLKGESVNSIHKDYSYIKKSTFNHYCSGRALRQRGII